MSSVDTLAQTQDFTIPFLIPLERSMYKALALYPRPEDPQAFREHYERTHLPLVVRLRGVRSVRYSFDLTGPQGESPYFAVFEVEWDDAEAMARSLSSPEGEAVAADMAPYVTEDTVILDYSLSDAVRHG